ncbi:MAG: aminotransferase class IV [Bacteroidota bacterium]
MQLIETIRTCNRRLENIKWHNERFNKSRQELFGETEKIDLRNIINIPLSLPRTVHKCRVVYDKKIIKSEFIAYQAKRVRTIGLITDNEIEYNFKYTDRSCLHSLLAKSRADEIIIVKNNFITDASYANVCFFDGEKWWTPANPLLAGTMRSKLIFQQKIYPTDIRPSDLRLFKKVKLINAMLVFENTPALDIEKISNSD